MYRASRHRAWALRFYDAEKKHFAIHKRLKKAAKRHWAKYKQHQYWLARNAAFRYGGRPSRSAQQEVEVKKVGARTPVANGHVPHQPRKE
jgi:hypothetical protein